MPKIVDRTLKENDLMMRQTNFKFIMTKKGICGRMVECRHNAMWFVGRAV